MKDSPQPTKYRRYDVAYRAEAWRLAGGLLDASGHQLLYVVLPKSWTG